MAAGGRYKVKRMDVEADAITPVLMDSGDAAFGVLDATHFVRAARRPRVRYLGSRVHS